MIAWDYILISAGMILVVIVAAARLLSVWLQRSSGIPSVETENRPLSIPATNFQVTQLRNDIAKLKRQVTVLQGQQKGVPCHPGTTNEVN